MGNAVRACGVPREELFITTKFTLTDDDLQEIRLLDTGRNVTGWPSDALKYNPKSK